MMTMMKVSHHSSAEDSMKVYYIDDSFFQNSPFSKEMLERFLNKIEHLNQGIILISSTHTYEKEIKHFKDEISSDLVVLQSPAVFDIHGIRGNLRSSFLALEDFDSVQTFSGSCIEYDVEAHTCERIYFDLFPKHYHLNELEMIMDHLEDVLSDKVKNFKKKKDRIS